MNMNKDWDALLNAMLDVIFVEDKDEQDHIFSCVFSPKEARRLTRELRELLAAKAAS